MTKGKPKVPHVEWEKVTTDGYANGNRTCNGRAQVPGGWIYEFTRWEAPNYKSIYGVFVPDPKMRPV